MGIEAYSDEQLKGMLESCIKGKNSTMEKEIRDILNSRGVSYEELLNKPFPPMVLGWSSPSD